MSDDQGAPFNGTRQSGLLWLLCLAILLLVTILATFESLHPQLRSSLSLLRTVGPARIPSRDAFNRPGTTLGSLQSLAFLDGNTMSCADLRYHVDLTKIESTVVPTVEQQTSPFLMGKAEVYGEDAQRCVTYVDRFSRYTDQALGINYRTVTNGTRFERHPLFGFHQPTDMKRKEWEQEMKKYNRLFNARTQIDGKPLRMPDWQALIEGCGRADPIQKGNRTAVVLRTSEGAVWTEDDVLTARALITELILAHPEQGWGLVIMVEVPNDSKALLSFARQQDILSTMMPKEFWPFVHFWNPSMGRLLFPGLPQKGTSRWDRYTSGRDCLMVEQILFSFPSFAARYDYVQNWEADTRFIGDFRTLFHGFDRYARAEPLDPTLERYHHYYIPGSKKSRSEFEASEQRLAQQPRGQPADLIVQTPIWDAKENAFWGKGVDPTGYNMTGRVPMSSMANYKMSARLVQAYNKATWWHGKSLYCEAWPTTVVMHSHMAPSKDQTFETQQELDALGGPLKAVYPSHPIRFEGEGDTTVDELEEVLGPVNHDIKVLYKGSYNWASLPEHIDFYSRWRLNGTCDSPYLVHPVKNTWY